ncbi:MAG: hemolysin secretion protein D [Gammaproteobacteria bacterium]|nr:hemolysin secretion protein D [Gammaproteobacteria bacterium]
MAFKSPRNDIEFMTANVAAELESLPLSGHLILILGSFFAITAIVWANFATLEEVARAEGRVIPSGQVQVVQNLEGGILTSVKVKPGQSVKAGQTMLTLDDTHFASSYREGKLTSNALVARIARLTAEIEGQRFTDESYLNDKPGVYFGDEIKLYQIRKQELESSIEILKQQKTQFTTSLAKLRDREKQLYKNAQISQNIFERNKPLVETGAVSHVELLQLEAAVNESLGKLEETRGDIQGSVAAVKEAEKKIQERYQQFISAAQAELNIAKTELKKTNVSNVALEDRVRRTEVKSPVNGTINQVLVNTIGAVVQPGMALVDIVPTDDTLLIEARIRPADIAFVYPGQQAKVKLTAYDFAIYGGLDSVIELISADSITDQIGGPYFKVQVRTQKNYLGTESNPLPIIPGMMASVDIITGEKTVMDYILNPLRRAQSAAMTER